MPTTQDAPAHDAPAPAKASPPHDQRPPASAPLFDQPLPCIRRHEPTGNPVVVVAFCASDPTRVLIQDPLPHVESHAPIVMRNGTRVTDERTIDAVELSGPIDPKTLPAATAQRFGIDPDIARAVLCYRLVYARQSQVLADWAMAGWINSDDNTERFEPPPLVSSPSAGAFEGLSTEQLVPLRQRTFCELQATRREQGPNSARALALQLNLLQINAAIQDATSSSTNGRVVA
ncbi:MAG: hypothetical protein AAGB51_06100 [Planctomycetota bacterium]